MKTEQDIAAKERSKTGVVMSEEDLMIDPYDPKYLLPHTMKIPLLDFKRVKSWSDVHGRPESDELSSPASQTLSMSSRLCVVTARCINLLLKVPTVMSMSR